eukprot:UC4_evm1s1331
MPLRLSASVLIVTLASTFGPSLVLAECSDDPLWYARTRKARNCNWVSLRVPERCSQTDKTGLISAYTACPTSCCVPGTKDSETNCSPKCLGQEEPSVTEPAPTDPPATEPAPTDPPTVKENPLCDSEALMTFQNGAIAILQTPAAGSCSEVFRRVPLNEPSSTIEYCACVNAIRAHIRLKDAFGYNFHYSFFNPSLFVLTQDPAVTVDPRIPPAMELNCRANEISENEETIANLFVLCPEADPPATDPAPTDPPATEPAPTDPPVTQDVPSEAPETCPEDCVSDFVNSGGCNNFETSEPPRASCDILPCFIAARKACEEVNSAPSCGYDKEFYTDAKTSRNCEWVVAIESKLSSRCSRSNIQSGISAKQACQGNVPVRDSE